VDGRASAAAGERAAPPAEAAATDLTTLVDRLRALAANGRVIVGITGTPAAGKSTLAAALAERLGDAAAVVGMDGFHLAQDELVRLGRADRKGAPDTFDVAGYVALLRRLRAASGTVYAPEFRRDIEEPIANAVAVDAQVPIVLTEGNYLLLDSGGWQDVASLLDEVWFVDVPPEERHRRLVQRRTRGGASEVEALRWAQGSDAQNARTVDATRGRADLIVTGLPPVSR
jgi:pantothenate kinase